jgi:hypothetical protein
MALHNPVASTDVITILSATSVCITTLVAVVMLIFLLFLILSVYILLRVRDQVMEAFLFRLRNFTIVG